MKKNVIVCLNIIVLLILGIDKRAFSWNEEVTHPVLSQNAAKNSVLNKINGDYLKNIGFKENLGEYLKWGANEKTVEAWLQEGSKLEDASSPLFPVAGTTRSLNHFHNPLKQWQEWSTAGLDDWFINHYTGESSVLWAQDSANQQNAIKGDWSWQKGEVWI